jgi:hypothetical protein
MEPSFIQEASESVRSWFLNGIIQSGFTGNLYEMALNGSSYIPVGTYPYLGSLTGGTLSDLTPISYTGVSVPYVTDTGDVGSTPTEDYIIKAVNRGWRFDGTSGATVSSGVPFNQANLNGTTNSGYGNFTGGDLNYVTILISNRPNGYYDNGQPVASTPTTYTPNPTGPLFDIFLATECVASGTSLVSANSNELDITKPLIVNQLVDFVKPAVIVNTAAWTDVDGAETNQTASYAVNALGPQNLAAAASKIGARLVQISTDYVFSGDTTSPRSEKAPHNPQCLPRGEPDSCDSHCTF